MIELQDGDGLVFWPKTEVASLTPEFRNRWRGVHRDGSVAHRPSPPPAGPWVALGNALVNPAWLERTPTGWRDPAGFTFPPQEIASLPPAAAEPDIAGIPCRRHQIYGLKGLGLHSLWLTDVGEFPWKNISSPEASQALPDLILLRRGLYLNRRRLRRARHDYFNYYLDLDNGLVYKTTKQNEALPGRLGLPNLLHLEPRQIEMYGNYQLRDWPFELATAPAELLKAHFPTARQLIGHLIWQRLRYRQLGLRPGGGGGDPGLARPWADSYRGFWYDPLVHTLYRAGFLQVESLRWQAPESPEARAQPTSADGLYMLLFQIMDFFVTDAGLFNFHEFGFVEPRPDCRRIGTLRPDVILVAEKEAFHDYALRLCQEFGVSLRLLNSQPPLLGSEYFATALAQVVSGPVRVIAYVDYDTGGWILGHALAKQLEFFGLAIDRVDFLIRQDSFTPDEKRLYAHPCASGDKTHITKNKLWVKESGGIDGKALGIHSDHVRPYERVRELFARLLA